MALLPSSPPPAPADLSANDRLAAFARADRRCRLVIPSARDLLLRAQAHRACGRRAAAERDLAAAATLDPNDFLIAQAAMAWGPKEIQAEAARRLLAAADPALRRRAVEILLAAGGRIVWRLSNTNDGVAGWLAWTGGEGLRLAVGPALSFDVDPDPAHPLASRGVHAADVVVETAEAFLTLSLSDGTSLRAAPEKAANTRKTVVLRNAREKVASPPFLTVIVPVYEDFAATRACLQALASAPPRIAHRLVVVDDASPNVALRDWLDAKAAEGAFELLRNDVNLGFAASVNRVLAERDHGDALLLNADALPPPGAIDRLARLSRSSPGVGTLTPFSNNGELTSWPRRHEANPLPDMAEIAALDARAEAVNGDALVDIPNGIGFCLYITEACLDALGALPELYAQGYYEDVEFALAARERGFRNVAAPGVFVGHAGSRSFGPRKRALVARNLDIVESRFPGYRLETAAFVARDPLQPFRAALDAASPPKRRVALAVGGEDETDAPPDVIPLLRARTRGAVLSLTASDGAAPQSLTFDFAKGGASAFAAYLAALEIVRVEWRDPAAPPEPALEALLALPVPHVLRVAALGPFLPTLPARLGPCDELGVGPCAACRGALTADAAGAGRRARLARVLGRVERIEPLDRMAESFARRVFKTRVASLASETPAPPQARPIRRLGVLYPRRSVAAERLLLALSRRLSAESGARLVILGAALDDEALMATGRAFVTGRVAPADYAELAGAYELDALFGPERGAGFGELEATASACGLAKAYFDGSFGGLASTPGDLSLDPRICDVKTATAVIGWIGGSA